jgi:hypothetical protein
MFYLQLFTLSCNQGVYKIGRRNASNSRETCVMQIRTGASGEGAKFKSKQNIDAKLEDTF